jgi:hypothetical protein
MQDVIPSASLSILRIGQQPQIEDLTPQIEILPDSHIGESYQSEASLSETAIASSQLVPESPVSPLDRSSLSPTEQFYYNFLLHGKELHQLQFELALRLLFPQDDIFINCRPVMYAYLIFLSKMRGNSDDALRYRQNFDVCMNENIAATSCAVEVIQGWLAMICQCICSGDVRDAYQYFKQLRDKGRHLRLLIPSASLKDLPYPHHMWGEDTLFLCSLSDLPILRHPTGGADDIETLRWNAYILTSTLSHFLKTRYRVGRKEMVHDTATDDLFKMISIICQSPLGETLDEKIGRPNGTGSLVGSPTLLPMLCDAAQKDVNFASQLGGGLLEWVNFRLVLTPLLQHLFCCERVEIHDREIQAIALSWCRLLRILGINPWEKMLQGRANSSHELWSSLVFLSTILLRPSQDLGKVV